MYNNFKIYENTILKLKMNLTIETLKFRQFNSKINYVIPKCIDWQT